MIGLQAEIRKQENTIFMTDAVINIKFFASLREQVGLADVQISKAGVSTVMDAWNRATENRDMPENTLMAVNMDYVSAEHTVNVGDEVAFFPPVTGG